MSVMVKGSGGGSSQITRVATKKGSCGTSTTTLYTMQNDGFVVGCYVGHNEANPITVYKNSTQIGYSNQGSRQLQQGEYLYEQLSAGDAIKVKGNSNSWCGYNFQFFEEG